MEEDAVKCWQWTVVVEMLTQAQVWPLVGGSFPSQAGLLHAPALPSLSWDYPALSIAGLAAVPLGCQLPAAVATARKRGSVASSRRDVSEPASLSSPLQSLVFVPIFPIKAKCNADSSPPLLAAGAAVPPPSVAGLAWVAPLPPPCSKAAGAAER